MTLRPPSRYANIGTGTGTGSGPLGVLDHELAGEKAAALGRAGERAEKALALLRAASEAERSDLTNAAARAVHAYFIQRELCGLRRHHDVIREYDIPATVLARLGAS